MTWLILIAFATCSQCEPDTIMIPADKEWCLDSLRGWEAQSPSTASVTITSGPHAGQVYPVTGVWCLEPDDAAALQEP